MRVTLAKENWASLQVPLSKTNLEKVRAIPSRYRWVGDRVEFESTVTAMKYVQKSWPAIEWDDSMRPLTEAALFIEDNRQLERVPLTTFAFKTKPFEHQAKAFELSKDKHAFALLMDMGTGKSKVIIDTAAYLYSQGEISGMIVFAPNGVHRNWVDNEIKTHMPDWVDWKAHYYRSPSNSSKKHNALWQEAYNHQGLAIITVHIEAMSYADTAKIVMEFISERKGRVLSAVDESTRIKNPAATRTEKIIKAGRASSHRRIASGLPTPESPLDIFSQYEFMGSNLLGFNNYWAFQKNYAIMKEIPGKTSARGRPVEIVVGYRSIGDLQERINKHAFRVTKEECLDLPEKTYVKRLVELSAEQRKHYKELVTELMTELKGELITVELAITKILRLRQVIGGFIGGQSIEPNPRLDDFKAWTEEVRGKTLIWAEFHDEIAAISTFLAERYGPASVVQYHGKIGGDARALAVRRLQNDPACDWFVGQPASGGIGLTLTAAQNTAYYSNGPSLENRLQSEMRNYRIGQRNCVTYTDWVAVDTYDEKQLNNLRDKRDLSTMVTGDELLSWL